MFLTYNLMNYNVFLLNAIIKLIQLTKVFP